MSKQIETHRELLNEFLAVERKVNEIYVQMKENKKFSENKKIMEAYGKLLGELLELETIICEEGGIE